MATNQAGIPPIEVPFLDRNGTMSQAWRTWFQVVWGRIGASTGGIIVPTGSILAYSGTNAPLGFLFCDGSNVSRSTYSTLFSIIGVTWGPGDGSSTFTLPALSDRVLLGAGSTYVLGDTGGTNELTLDVTNLPAHIHTITDPGHAHSIPVGAATGTGALLSTGTTGSTGSSLTGITQTDATGSGDPLDITPNFGAVNYLIAT